jgi:hypothetical protein
LLASHGHHHRGSEEDTEGQD